jgi:hypothetical protein
MYDGSGACCRVEMHKRPHRRPCSRNGTSYSGKRDFSMRAGDYKHTLFPRPTPKSHPKRPQSMQIRPGIQNLISPMLKLPKTLKMPPIFKNPFKKSEEDLAARIQQATEVGSFRNLPLRPRENPPVPSVTSFQPITTITCVVTITKEHNDSANLRSLRRSCPLGSRPDVRRLRSACECCAPLDPNRIPVLSCFEARFPWQGEGQLCVYPELHGQQA